MNEHYVFINTPLPYPFNAMEPFIDEKTMNLHHDKHLQTYVDNLNKELSKYPRLQRLSLEQLLKNPYNLPGNARTSIMNNAGGIYNHRFFFNGLMNPNDSEPFGELAHAINRTYGDYEKFKSAFKASALSVFGSGYAWLAVDKFGIVMIITTANQDTPLFLNLYPIVNIDVWEHAYYLKHYNKRVGYIDDWFNVVNWEKANNNYLQCMDK